MDPALTSRNHHRITRAEGAGLLTREGKPHFNQTVGHRHLVEQTSAKELQLASSERGVEHEAMDAQAYTLHRDAMLRSVIARLRVTFTSSRKSVRLNTRKNLPTVLRKKGDNIVLSASLSDSSQRLAGGRPTNCVECKICTP
jgi:hypothetical protein